jgi:hypothetical protein
MAALYYESKECTSISSHLERHAEEIRIDGFTTLIQADPHVAEVQ